MILLPWAGAQQDDVPSVFELRQHSSRSLMLSGVTDVMFLSDGICAIAVTPSAVRVTALEVGESLVYIWVGEKRYEMLVRVGPPAPPQQRPALADNSHEADALGHGYVGGFVQNAAAGQAGSVFSHSDVLQWSQKVGLDDLNVSMNSQGETAPGMPRMGVNRVAIQYLSRDWSASLMDSVLNWNGAFETQFRAGMLYNPQMLRGLQFEAKGARNSINVFAGAILPQSFLRWSDTRDIAGVTLRRTISSRFSVFFTSAFTYQPPFDYSSRKRTGAVTQMIGASWRPSELWKLEATGAVSSQGQMAEAGAEYADPRRTLSVRATETAASFPFQALNLLQLRGRSVTGTYTDKLTNRLLISASLQHVLLPAVGGSPASSSSFANGSAAIQISRFSQLSLVHTRANLLMGARRTDTQRSTASLGTQLFRDWSDTVQFEYGKLYDSMGQNSRSDITLFHTLNGRVGPASLYVSARYERSDATLLSRLYSDLSLLPQDARDAFLRDPEGFLSSPLLTPELRMWLAGLVPTSTQVQVGAQFTSARRRLNFSPYMAWDRQRSISVGYSVAFQATRNLSLRSSLTRAMYWDPQSQLVREDSVLMFGFVRNLFSKSQVPLVSAWQRAVIAGSVFEDVARTGVPVDEKHGVAGIVVELDNGEKTTTDAQGRFRFAGLKPGKYTVHVPLAQFASSLRVTTPVEVSLDVSMAHFASANFGVVRLGRVFGIAFNDIKMNGIREKDAPAIGEVRIVATTSGFEGSATTSKDGAFELKDLPPAQYSLAIDPATVPPGYMIPETAETLTLAQAASIYREIPLRALRSVSGRVLRREDHTVQPAAARSGKSGLPEGNQAPTMRPVAGVHVLAGGVLAISDDNGDFLLRGLPAGEIEVTLQPMGEVPTGLTLPSGKLQLPAEPVEKRDLVVMISNPELVRLLSSSDRPRPAQARPARQAVPLLSLPVSTNEGAAEPDQQRR
jgi:hypothetical protein